MLVNNTQASQATQQSIQTSQTQVVTHQSFSTFDSYIAMRQESPLESMHQSMQDYHVKVPNDTSYENVSKMSEEEMDIYFTTMNEEKRNVLKENVDFAKKFSPQEAINDAVYQYASKLESDEERTEFFEELKADKNDYLGNALNDALFSNTNKFFETMLESSKNAMEATRGTPDFDRHEAKAKMYEELYKTAELENIGFGVQRFNGYSVTYQAYSVSQYSQMSSSNLNSVSASEYQSHYTSISFSFSTYHVGSSHDFVRDQNTLERISSKLTAANYTEDTNINYDLISMLDKAKNPSEFMQNLDFNLNQFFNQKDITATFGKDTPKEEKAYYKPLNSVEKDEINFHSFYKKAFNIFDKKAQESVGEIKTQYENLANSYKDLLTRLEDRMTPAQLAKIKENEEAKEESTEVANNEETTQTAASNQEATASASSESTQSETTTEQSDTTASAETPTETTQQSA